MTAADKYTTIAENQHRIYQAGYDKGKAEGGEVGDDYVVEAPPKTIKTYTDNRSMGFANNAFKGFTELTTVTVPNALVIGQRAFEGCSKLEFMQIGCATRIDTFAFKDCTGLRKFINGYSDYDFQDGNIATQAFSGCTNLEIVDLTWFCGVLSTACFEKCSNLKTVIFRNDIQASSTYDPTLFAGTPIGLGNGYIYVPSKFLADYQGVFTKYADQIRALEDYTVDGSTYGELDETKI